jgi:SAM-dependent methyltransferase
MEGNNISDFWVKSAQDYATLEKENRKTILFPAIAEQIDLSEGQNILDYGGGDGGFLEFFVHNKVNKYLYDPSEGMIRFAEKKRHSITQFNTSDLNLPNKFFDIITLIHVVTVIKENEELNRIFDRIHSLLNDSGTLIIGLTHPAFKHNFFSTFHTDFSSGKIDFAYLEDGLPYDLYLQGNTKEKFVVFECYHRPISSILNMAISNGFLISRILEIPDNDSNNPNRKFLFPPFLVLIFKKIVK